MVKPPLTIYFYSIQHCYLSCFSHLIECRYFAVKGVQTALFYPSPVEHWIYYSFPFINRIFKK